VTEIEDGGLIEAGDVPLRVVATPGLEPEAVTFVVGEGLSAVTGDLDGQRGARSIFGPVDREAWQHSVARLALEAPGARWLGGHPAVDSGA
jgi:glyoxylase-like metal-dependent hydrolase (beta-lactamase superfamily II)